MENPQLILLISGIILGSIFIILFITTLICYLMAFYNKNKQDKTDEIILPNSLKTISSRAFNSCNKLKEITIPAGVETIGDAAFAECLILSKINVAEGNNNFTVAQDCLIDIPNKKLLQGFVSSVIPQDGTVTSFGRYCFAYMPIESIKIPASIKSINDNAFSHCELLQNVELPDTLKELRDACFSWCKKLSNINLPEGLTDIRTYAFNECKLKAVIIPSTVTNIMERAFGYLTELESVTFKKSFEADGTIKVPTIHSRAFINSVGENSPITLNLPWSADQHYKKFACNDDGIFDITKDPTFGAIDVYFERIGTNEDGTGIYNTNIMFDYEEEAN